MYRPRESSHLVILLLSPPLVFVHAVIYTVIDFESYWRSVSQGEVWMQQRSEGQVWMGSPLLCSDGPSLSLLKSDVFTIRVKMMSNSGQDACNSRF